MSWYAILSEDPIKLAKKMKEFNNYWEEKEKESE